MLWATEELGLKYKVVPVRLMTGEQRTPDFLSRNPMGVVTLLELSSKHDDCMATTLTESGGIVSFLAHLCGGLQAPSDDVSSIAAYHLYSAFAVASMDPLLRDIRLNEQLLPPEKAIPDFASRARKSFVAKVLPTFDAALAASDDLYLTGTTFTTVDILVGYSLFWASACKDLLTEATPRVLKYALEVQSRPAFQLVTSKSFAESHRGSLL